MKPNHTGLHLMSIRGTGEPPERTLDVGSRALRCEPCDLPVLTPAPHPVCPRCGGQLTESRPPLPMVPGGKGWAVP